ncbi:MAG: 5'-nucleotidase C-terminal domain-containing protein, partial [Longispora sp.]|nr:5'-nucleotidase C-terminal domain-containing protein [Longispora sp. (in: high G+C Gram-positive bacteria)]
LIADAQLAATSSPENGGAEIAFVNPGGIRTDLAYRSTGVETPGTVTYGDAYAVHPFNNSLITKNMTGTQILALLNQQFTGTNSGTGVKILQVSKGFTYTLTNYTTVTDVRLNGAPLDLARTYRVAMNSFIADGGDGFMEFARGTQPLIVGVDLDALTAYLSANSSKDTPLPVPTIGRITFN